MKTRVMAIMTWKEKKLRLERLSFYTLLSLLCLQVYHTFYKACVEGNVLMS